MLMVNVEAIRGVCDGGSVTLLGAFFTRERAQGTCLQRLGPRVAHVPPRPLQARHSLLCRPEPRARVSHQKHCTRSTGGKGIPGRRATGGQHSEGPRRSRRRDRQRSSSGGRWSWQRQWQRKRQRRQRLLTQECVSPVIGKNLQGGQWRRVYGIFSNPLLPSRHATCTSAARTSRAMRAPSPQT